MDNELQVRLLHAAKTQDQWKAVTSYPKKGEVCLEAINSSGATAFKIKIGDGTRPYCQNTAAEGETPVWDFTSNDVLPYFGSVIETSGTVNVVAISTYNTTKKKLSFYTLGLSASTSGGSTTITPTIASSPYLEIIEGTGVEFTTDETGTVKEFYINLAATTEATATTITDGGTFTAITPDSNHKATKYTTFTLPSIADAIAELDTDSPLALVEYDSSTTTLSIYTISETDGVISKSSTAATTIDLSGVAPVQDVQINSTSILDNSGNANFAVEGTYNASSNKIATESTVSDAVEGLDVNGYAQAEIDTTTTSGQTTLTIKGIEEVNGEIAVDTTTNTSIVIDGTYNASTNKIATESTVSDAVGTAVGALDAATVGGTDKVITTISETDGVISATSVDKTDIAPVQGVTTTDTGDSGIEITTSNNVKDVHHKTIVQNNTDTSSIIGEKELPVITGVNVDSYGHITGVTKDVSSNLIAADIKAPVKQTDNSTWNHRVTGGDISIGEDTAKIPVLKGNTIVWNQLVDSSATSITLVSGNKYYTVIDGTKSIQTGAGTDITVTGGTDIVINLTKMFGSNNEPSTVEAFEKLFSNSYYEYNEGELVSLGGYNEPDEELWVDMGLPSGILWAKSNIDVTQPNGFAESPYQYGCTMFSWGNTEGHNTPASGTTFDYNWGSVNSEEPWYDGQPYGSTKGKTLQKDIPEGKEFDAARANLGNLWREPKSTEFKELFDNCDFIDASGNIIPASTTDKRVTVNNIVGLYLQSKTNGNRLFFACSGYGAGSSWNGRGAYGIYWSASFGSARNARRLVFDSGGVLPQNSNSRCNGFAVRPVLSKQDKFGVKSIGFNQWDEEWELGTYNTTDGSKNTTTTEINLRAKNKCICLPSTIYYNLPYTLRFFFYDGNENFLESFVVAAGGTVFTTPSNARFFTFHTGIGIPTYNHDICINISDPVKNSTYEPYKQDTLDLSWIKDIKDSNDNQLFPYGLLKAGSVYDEVTESKAIKRIGSVDLGSLNYSYAESADRGNTFTTPIEGAKNNNSLIISTCGIYVPMSANYIYGQGKTADKIVAIEDGNKIRIHDFSYTDADVFKDAMNGVMLYYELATPIEVDIVPAKNMSYLVNDLGTETQLPVNPTTTTPITAPFVGTFEYKSNFKDTVIDLIDKVNNAANPVKGINNTDQTVGKIAVYDSERTIHSSDYSASNATIVETAEGNNITLPSVAAIVNYVNNKLSSALTYKGTISEWSDLPTSGQNTGDMYIADTTFTESGVTYQAGDFFIWNGTNWDIVSGTTSVVNSNPTLNLDGGTYQVGTVDGIALQVTTPDLDYSSPTASGTSLEYIDTVSQSNGLISATKKSLPNASTTQAGVTSFVSDIHYSTDNDKTATAKQIWVECEKRNVQFVEAGVVPTGLPMTEDEFINTYAYGVRWIQGESACARVGSQMAIDTMPVHNSFRACVYQINTVTNGFDVTETIDGVDYTVHYGARREFLYWLDDDDWTKKSDGTTSVIDGTGNTGVAIYHDRFYGKSFEGVTYNGRSDYNAVYVSPIQYDETWVEIKEGFVDFAKATIVSGKARCYTGATPTISTPRKAMHAAALESGGHMMSYDEYKWIFYWLPVIEFKTFQVESNTTPSTWSWGSDIVNRDSLTGNDIPEYGYPMLYSSSTLGYNYITSGFTNALGTHTGWVKYTNASYSANVLPAARWRGFEIQRCNWTNVQGYWGEQTNSHDTIFATKNRALFSAYISSGNNEKHCIVNLDDSELANVTSAINNETWALDSTDNLWKSTTYKVRDQHIRYVGKQVGGGFIGEFALNALGDMIPKSITDKKYDYSYTNALFSSSSYYNPRSLLFGGGADGGSYGGPGFLHSYFVASYADGSVAFRVCWNIDEYTSVMN